MNIKAGLVGLPNVGKSTLFNTLTNNNIPSENYPFCTKDPHVARTEIYDKRINNLKKIYNSENVIYPYVDFVDIAGLVRGASQGAGLGNQFLANIREVSTLIHVLRCFDNDNIINVEASIDPIRDFETIMFEFAQKDLEVLNNRFSRIDIMIKKANASDKIIYQKEKEYLQYLINIIEDMKFIEQRYLFSDLVVSHLNLLLGKKYFVVANISENDLINPLKNKYLPSVLNYFGEENVVPLSILFENEVQQINVEERSIYYNEYNLHDSSIDRIISLAYRQLELITFFTCGPKEIHAWTIKKDTNIKDAAGEIHSDLSRGFISAEVISYLDIVEHGSELNVKNAGKIKVVGSQYTVHDGDILSINFNV